MLNPPNFEIELFEVTRHKSTEESSTKSSQLQTALRSLESTSTVLESESLQKVVIVILMCVVIRFILDVRLVDVPAGVTQKKGYTEFLHLPSAVLALIFIARRIQPFLSLVDREVEVCVLTD